MKKILTSFICLGLATSAFAAPRLRALTPSQIGSVRAAASSTAGNSTGARLTTATNTASSRLSTSSFLNNRGKLGTSVSQTPSTGGNSGGNVDLSDYATIEQFEDLESQISELEGKITTSDAYTKQEVDDIISDLTLNGVPGPQGEPGSTGPQGTPGLSAYQIAVQNGFVGTEAEWLASLGGNNVIENGGGTDGSYIIDVNGGNVTYTPIDVTDDVFTE